MNGRFPGARTLEEFWQNLKDGTESIRHFAEQEVLAAGVDPALLESPNYVPAGGALADADLFDAQFFGYNPREAEITDPQQRLFLEAAWELLEQAGYNPDGWEGRIGLYAGAGPSTYLFRLLEDPDMVRSVGLYQMILANDKDHLTTRAAYKLNLTGPCVTVQTACSTSLVAVHIACQSLLNHDCDMALAGGVSILWPQGTGYLHQEGGILSPDGHCRAFDAAAAGTVSGSGLGIVALKRYEDALRDGDTVHALILGTAINNDGSDKVGYTAPSVDGQAAVIAEALAAAGVSPRTIGYVEAHGTGTALGDPIEVAALTQAFRQSTADQRFCAIGSLKSNIGHLDSAAGVAGLIKAVLALKNRQIPPSIHFTTPNPRIPFHDSPFYVSERLTSWEEGPNPRRAAVSSFGMGGTNAHLILEEVPPAAAGGPSRPVHLLALSARTEPALEAATANLAQHLREHPDIPLADVAYTLHMGRRAFHHRRVLVCGDTREAAEALTYPDRLPTGIHEDGERPVVFMFTGQGAQHVNMARDLYEQEPLFRAQVDQMASLLMPHLGTDLRRLLFPDPDQKDAAAGLLRRTEYAQPALFVIEYALAQLWLSWGVVPAAMIGHSVGEYVAACLAGTIGLEDALALVAARGKLIQQLPGGAMLSVSLPEADLLPLLGPELALAAVNGPALCAVAGPEPAVKALEALLKTRGVSCSRLHTSHAFHSWMVEPAVEPFVDLVRQGRLHPPTIPFISNVTGRWIRPEEALDPQYWGQHLRQPVRFAAGLEQLRTDLPAVFLEVGPGQVLSTLARQGLPAESVVLSSLPRPKSQKGDLEALLTTLGRLWLAGARVDWQGFYAGQSRRRIPLPTYPFERQRYALTPGRGARALAARSDGPAQKQPISDSLYLPSWKRTLRRRVSTSGQGERLLLFSGGTSLEARLAERLQRMENQVTIVRMGDRFADLGGDTYSLDPSREEEYDRLLQTLHDQGELPDRIIHGWSLPPVSPEGGEWARFLRGQTVGFNSLLFLARALSRQAAEHPVRLTAVTHSAQAVALEERLHPEQATLLGASLVIPQEYPVITCSTVDLLLPEGGTPQEQALAERLVEELFTEDPDMCVAYRGADRWVQTYEPVRAEAPADDSTMLRHGGVYLIIGGLGRLGMLLADHLARTVKGKLVLITRSAFPERQDWERWQASHQATRATDRISRAITQIRQMEAHGAEVLVLRADGTDEAALRAALQTAVERFGTIHGVIHSAMAGPIATIQASDPADWQVHFAAKVRVGMLLARLVAEHQPDFVLLMSSLSSVLGGIGMAPYAAANLGLDGFAHLQNRAGQFPWITINWEGWRLAEGAVQSSIDPLALSPEEGIELFRRLMAFPAPTQVVVSGGDLVMRLDRWVRRNTEPSAPRPARAPGNGYSRPALPTPYEAPGNSLEEAVAELFQELLGVTPVGAHDSFFELGGHSLLGTQLITRLRQRYQVELPIHSLFEGPTVRAIAAQIVQLQEQDPQEGDDAIRPSGSEAAAALLARLDELSDEEVEALLQIELGTSPEG